MKLLFKIILALNSIALLALLLSVSSQWINPQRTWVPAFLGLGFPIVVVTNAVFAFFWIIVRKRWWMVSAIPLALTLVFAVKYFAFHPFTGNHMGEGHRILSYNVQNFDLYNWKHNTESRDSIIALIKRQKPDIVCFQEFYAEDGGFVTEQKLSRELGLPYHRFAKTFTLHGKDHWGMATFSRFPIIHYEFTAFEGTRLNGLLRTDLVIDSDTVRVFNAHLQSIRFDPTDFEHFEENYQRSSRRIASKLREGYRNRADQAKLIAERIKASPHPVLVCGDFNDTPVSFTYRTIARGLKDAFIRKSTGVGTTYAGSLPGLRIDYILIDRSMDIHGFKRLRKRISDHYPVMASFSLN